MLFEPRVVSRSYRKTWGKRKIDLAELYDLRVNQGLSLREIERRLGIPRATLIDNLRRAESLYAASH
jgi:DNA-binding transcriptional regulator LsrR (DeoR family)